jgi:hypothetical protein
MTENTSGIDQLHERRARRARQAPQPRHPKLAATLAGSSSGAVAVGESTAAPGPTTTNPADHSQREVAANSGGEIAAAAPGTGTANPEPAPGGATAETPSSGRDIYPGDEGWAVDLPKFEIDPTDPTAHMVSPTVLSIPGSIVERFERARANAPSHTALVLDALRAHVGDLPALILNRRPGLKPGDLFPFREAPGRTTTDTPLPLRIRPTKGELAVMKKLTDWASARIAEQRAGARETNRSEMVAAALDAFLPPAPSTKRRK